MPSTYSPSLKIQLMATGENTTTWGSITNNNMQYGLEEAIVGTASVTFASADQTLTLVDGPTTQTARHLRLNLTGTSGGARNLYVPAVEKIYVVSNGVADAVTIQTTDGASGGTGTSISVPAGKTMWVYGTGSNIVDVTTHLTSLTLETALPVASGGTGSNTASGARTNLSAAALGANTDITSLQTMNYLIEKATVSATAATGAIILDVMENSVVYLTTDATGNWTFNIRGDSGTTLDSLLATGEAVTVAFMVTNGVTAYYNTQVQIDGTTTGVTTKWQGGAAPTSGNSSSVDIYTYTVIKTGSATFSVFAAQTEFGT